MFLLGTLPILLVHQGSECITYIFNKMYLFVLFMNSVSLFHSPLHSPGWFQIWPPLLKLPKAPLTYKKNILLPFLLTKNIYILLPISQRNWAIWRESSHAPPPSYPPARRVSTLGLKTTCSLINPKYSAPPSNPSAWTYTNYLEACLQDPLGLPRDIEINIGVSKKYLLIPVLRKKGYIYPPSSWHLKHSSWPWFLTPLLSFPALLCPPAP